MRWNFKFFLLLSFCIFTPCILEAVSQKPAIFNFSRSDYGAGNKNWSIDSDEKGILYVGNDTGLLEFDGIEWKLNKLPDHSTVRSVSVLSNNLIFTGSFEDFGKWERDLSGELSYTSLSHNIERTAFKNDDFWRIWVTEELVYFQSFNSIFTYDLSNDEIKKIPFDKGILFLSKVRDDFFIQQIGGGLFRLAGDNLIPIEGSSFLSNTDVRVILPYENNSYLIGTTTKGLFIYDGASFKEWNQSLSLLMNAKELNYGIRSTSGNYYLGTILGGLYEISPEGKIIRHFSSDNALQNNTVLSIYEDHLQNIWLALDRGLAYIQYDKYLSYYTDPGGTKGAIYDATIWNKNLFIGTNQGVFYIPEVQMENSDLLTDMKLIEGTQGQVWSLKVINDRLYCGHNRGLKEINTQFQVMDHPDINTGVYEISGFPWKEQSLYLLATYGSIRFMDPLNNRLYHPEGINQPIYHTETDHLNNVWLEHFNKGVYRAQLNDDLSGFRFCTHYGGDSKDGLPYKLRLFKVGGRIVLMGDDLFFTYDDIRDKIISNEILQECFSGVTNIRQIIPIGTDLFWALSNSMIYKFYYDGYKAEITESYNPGKNFSLIHQYEKISTIHDSLHIICTDNGFILHNSPDSTSGHPEHILPLPRLTSIKTMDPKGMISYKETDKPGFIPFRFNHITFSFNAMDLFTKDLSFQYRLKEMENDWSEDQKINHISYARLPKGNYTFMIRTVDKGGKTSEIISYPFSILPPWYETGWAYILYVITGFLTLYACWMLILRRYRNIHLQKIRQRETKRLRELAGELQHEVEKKNAELLTQTSFIIHKNEIILKLKEIIEDYSEKHRTSSSVALYQKIQTHLENNMNTEDDWKLFLIKFEEKHTGFFKQMKILYPQLTTNDLRLCACLKLNLESKEIAALMNLSVKAIENNRYRLRKKLGLERNQNLYDFFLSLDQTT